MSYSVPKVEITNVYIILFCERLIYDVTKLKNVLKYLGTVFEFRSFIGCFVAKTLSTDSEPNYVEPWSVKFAFSCTYLTIWLHNVTL